MKLRGLLLNPLLQHKANEWQAEASDSKEAARALYTQLAESESNAAKLIMALEEERMRGAKAAHLVREKSSALGEPSSPSCLQGLLPPLSKATAVLLIPCNLLNLGTQLW